MTKKASQEGLEKVYKLYHSLVTRIQPFPGPTQGTETLLLFDMGLPPEYNHLIPNHRKENPIDLKLLKRLCDKHLPGKPRFKTKEEGKVFSQFNKDPKRLGYVRATPPDSMLKACINEMAQLVELDNAYLLHRKDTKETITCCGDLRGLWRQLELNENAGPWGLYIADEAIKSMGKQLDKDVVVMQRIGTIEGHINTLEAYFSEEHQKNLALIRNGMVKPPASDTEEAVNIFRKSGDIWEVAFEGEETLFLKNTKGLQYIAHLLKHPGMEFHVLKLVREVEGNVAINKTAYDRMSGEQLEGEGLNVSSDHGHAGEKLDPHAETDYKCRLKELDEDIEEAEGNNDTGKLDKLHEERESLKSELSSALGLRGSPRKFDNEPEKARKAVCNAIERSLEKIKESRKPLYKHLDKYLTRGSSLSYDPPESTTW
jgi:hypothetical protein